jgi:hypothetical protein
MAGGVRSLARQPFHRRAKLLRSVHRGSISGKALSIRTRSRRDFASFAAWCFRELNPRTRFALNWHFQVMAGKLAAVYHGRSRRLIVSLPPRHLKSHLASVAFPAWCLGHDPSAQIVCVAPGI